MDIRAGQRTNTKLNMEYCKSMSAIHAFISRVSTRSMGLDLPRAFWIKLNRLCSDVEPFSMSVNKCGLTLFSNREYGATEQTPDHIISQCPTHLAPQEISGLMVLDDKAKCCLNTLAVRI